MSGDYGDGRHWEWRDPSPTTKGEEDAGRNLVTFFSVLGPWAGDERTRKARLADARDLITERDRAVKALEEFEKEAAAIRDRAEELNAKTTAVVEDAVKALAEAEARADRAVKELAHVRGLNRQAVMDATEREKAARVQAEVERDRAVKELEQAELRYKEMEEKYLGAYARANRAVKERDEARAVAADFEAWLAKALAALGVETVFDIPDAALSGETRDRDADFWTEHRAWLSGETERAEAGDLPGIDT